MSRKPETRPAPRRLGVVSQMVAEKAGGMEQRERRNQEALIVPVGNIRPNPNQPRQVANAERDQELAENIRENGILEPLIVREVSEGQYEIVAGERRFRAAQAVGLASVPVIVKEYDDQQAQLVAVIENLQRVDLEAQDEARYFKFLADNYNYSYRKIAEMIHRSHGYVNERMRLLDEKAANSDKSNKRIENGQKLEKSQAAKEQAAPRPVRFSPRPLFTFEGWLDKARESVPKLQPDEASELKSRLAELRQKIDALEKELS